MSAAARACILGVAGPGLSAAERAFLARARPWGFILFARNLETPAQLRALCADLRRTVGWHAPIAIDQEGGRVARLGPPHWAAWPPALEAVAGLAPEVARAHMRARYAAIGAELADLGIDVNCAPLADIARPETHPILRNRCYGDTVQTVVAAARGVAEGLLSAGVLPVLKHIPGHGRATADSHLELPCVATPRAALEATDFAAFAALSDLPLGMTAHVVFEALDPGAPATTSPTAIAAIRGAMGFEGLLMSDDLGMQALTGDLGARARAALGAGCDLALHCSGVLAESEAVAASCPELSPAARARADRALALRRA